MIFLNEMGNKKEETKYSQTENFADNYLYFFIDKIQDCMKEEKEYNFIPFENEKGETYYYSNNKNNYNYTNGIGAYINYIIVDKKDGTIYTNVKSSNYKNYMENMKHQEIYWNIVDGEVETNLTYIDKENIKYNHMYNYNENMKLYDIYSSYDEEKTSQNTNFSINRKIYDFMLQHKKLPEYAYIISLILLIVISGYLLWSIGHKKGKKEINLNSIDKIPYEIITIVSLILIYIFIYILANIFNTINYIVLIGGTMTYFICYILCAIWGTTTIKRIKAKKFFESFLIYKIARWCCQKVKKYSNEIKKDMFVSKNIFWYYLNFIAISVILSMFFFTGVTLIILIIFWIWVYYMIMKYMKKQEEIKETLKKIYEGNKNVYIDEKEFSGTLKEMVTYINDIAGGFSNAIEESLKSERLKTELITNVSHDIKTPLTSIINYVDLLKKENIVDEKIKEYIQILDSKSQRLKKLTEDLVEASKVSSGNIKLNIEEINIKELINQSIGEFKDRFENKQLKIETTMPNEEVKIKADSRYMYRIIENLFSNITKYAQENSRVYIDIMNKNNEIEIDIKNISKERLNISSDELMQRFVRGDKSRYTEGSGLGLSIAKSLAELQKGKFDIVIDGDLFKVIMKW